MKKSIILSLFLSLFCSFGSNLIHAQIVFEPEQVDTTQLGELPQDVDTIPTSQVRKGEEGVFGAAPIPSTTTQKALVIGIADYQYEQKLSGPVNDARAIAGVLRKSNWKVYGYENLQTRASFQNALNKFVSELKPTDEALFYFSGHGFQSGKNYLVPAHAKIRVAQDIETQAFPLETVMQALLKSKCRVRVVILDACRNNLTSANKRIAGFTTGLKLMTANDIRVKPNKQGNKANPEISAGGTLVAYATAPGQPARDGQKFSVFTGALYKVLEQNQCSNLTDALQKTRLIVQQKTNDTQVPWESSSLTGKVKICAVQK